MSGAKELTKRLRKNADFIEYSVGGNRHVDLYREAASTIERLKDREITRQGVQISNLLGELAGIAAERDAALEQLHGQCGYCKHKSHMLESPCKGCVWFAAKEFIEGDYWEWIGLQKEEQG